MKKLINSPLVSVMEGLLPVARRILGAVAGAILFAGVGTAHAASIDFDPVNSVATLGDLVPSIDIAGSAFTDGSNGGGIKVTWDPAIVQLSAVTVSDIWDFDSVSAIDNILGEVTISVTNFLAPTATENFAIASLDFLTASVGVSPLGLAITSQWYDGTPAMVSPTLGSGSISVQAVPLPAAVWLFGSGMLGLVAVARRNKQV